MHFNLKRLQVCVWGRVVYKLNLKHNLGQNGNNYKITIYKTNDLRSNVLIMNILTKMYNYVMVCTQSEQDYKTVCL